MTAQAGVRPYTKGEEIWHAAIHGLAALASVVALIFLAAKAASHPDHLATLGAGLFGGGMVVLFTCSTLYHGAFESSFQPFFKMLDHSAIYIMIATGYAPFALILLPKEDGIPITIIVGVVALLGTLFKLMMYMLKRQHQFRWVSLILYLAMGWGAALLAKPLYNAMPAMGFYMLVAGGLCYTLGAGFYARKSMKYSHAIWHFMVFAGAACHFVSVYWFVL